MKLGIPKELAPGERRVATTPKTSGELIKKLGFEVLIEAGAGTDSDFRDETYAKNGCQIVDDADQVWQQADIILKVRAPNDDEFQKLREGQTLISFMAPGQNADLLQKFADRKATALAIDAVPRISRAQKLDALSSMANIAGYRAVVEAAASLFGRFFTGQITAAGKVRSSQSVGHRCGRRRPGCHWDRPRTWCAIVRAFDVRPEVADQVKSMGAEFLMLEFESDEEGGTTGGYAKTMSKEFIDAEMALFAAQAKEVDIIITTALIPGKPAPKLITKEMLDTMKTGSVIVDLASEQGGNCEATVPGEVVDYNGVHIVGYSDLASRLARTSSQLYGRNLYHLLEELGGAEDFQVNMDDVVIRSATVVHDGQITWPPPPVSVSATPGQRNQPQSNRPSNNRNQNQRLAGSKWLDSHWRRCYWWESE